MNMLNRFTTCIKRHPLLGQHVHSQTKRTQQEKGEKKNKPKIDFSKGKSNLYCITFCKRSLFGLFRLLWVGLSCVIWVIRTVGLQAAPLIQHLALVLLREQTHIPVKLISIVHCTLSRSCRHVLWVCASVCCLPVRPDKRCCAWPAVWSHLTAGTSAGWWELCRGRHAHINEIIWSADSRLPAEACDSSLLSSLCLFIKVDNGNTGGGWNLSTPNQVLSQAFIEDNKTHKNKNVSAQKKKKKAFNKLQHKPEQQHAERR